MACSDHCGGGGHDGEGGGGVCGGGGAGWARVGCIWLVKVVGERGVTRKSGVVISDVPNKEGRWWW